MIDGEPACFAPVEVRGRVLDLGTNAGIAGARVTAVDVNSAPASGVIASGTDGSYRLRIPAARAADGTPSPLEVTLRADASAYQSFPGPIRQALPVDVATAVDVDGTLVVQSTITDIGLIAQPAGTGTGSIHGIADVPDDGRGVLVVAEANGKGFAVIAANTGDYQIYNLEAGTYQVTAYSVGHVYDIGEATVNNATVELNLHLNDQAAGQIDGTVSIVDGGGASATSVIAFIESTFDPLTGRGVSVPGLRAPETGVPNISGAFSLPGTPPGNYVVVAAFENDGLVRDPDRCIAGTEDVHVTVAPGATVTAPTTFKITGALTVNSPGAVAAEPVTTVPTFSWVDDSSEDQYIVELFDAFGQQVWTKTIPGVSGSNPTLTYDGTAPLVSGMYYQWRVTSTRSTGGTTQCNISRSEDLKGVFFIP
ncbi:MAG TPA: hypothetical protein VFQ53_15630 [Kofleriaceae bacterium]|nr:hypothetical protein [Kofleriaceae bacterium]